MLLLRLMRKISRISARRYFAKGGRCPEEYRAFFNELRYQQ